MNFDKSRVNGLRKSTFFTLAIVVFVFALITIDFDWLPVFIFGPGMLIILRII